MSKMGCSKTYGTVGKLTEIKLLLTGSEHCNDYKPGQCRSSYRTERQRTWNFKLYAIMSCDCLDGKVSDTVHDWKNFPGGN